MNLTCKLTNKIKTTNNTNFTELGFLSIIFAFSLVYFLYYDIQIIQMLDFEISKIIMEFEENSLIKIRK